MAAGGLGCIMASRNAACSAVQSLVGTPCPLRPPPDLRSPCNQHLPQVIYHLAAAGLAQVTGSALPFVRPSLALGSAWPQERFCCDAGVCLIWAVRGRRLLQRTLT